ncbi:hypothetical protein PO909_025014 [Leuciscus waleckii]
MGHFARRCKGSLEFNVTEKVQIRLPGWERLEILVAKTGSYDSNMGSFDGEGQGLLQMFLGEALRRGEGQEKLDERDGRGEGLDFYQCPMCHPLLRVGRISCRDFSSGKIPLSG